ncbi:MAG: GNAT family N-acetyltransferase, partial [Oscillospiraceae bacterium]|nr:GNAT family N-acetyltransferase [Oscillospiraceae bacterium]
IKHGGCDIGYTAAKPDGDRLFISKIYLKKQERGKKYARHVVEFYTALAREKGMRAMWLTVNRHNDSTIAAYKALGFEIIGEGAADIGQGFVMDDYYMEKEV